MWSIQNQEECFFFFPNNLTDIPSVEAIDTANYLILIYLNLYYTDNQMKAYKSPEA